MRPVFIWAQAFIFVSHGTTHEPEWDTSIDSVVRGHHIYKTIRTPLLGEMLEAEREDENDHDEYTVAITGRGDIVRHVPGNVKNLLLFLRAWQYLLQTNLVARCLFQCRF